MKKFYLLAILLLALVLRFWKLDVYPALNADEAAIGYNAYSLIQTGKDEHGNSWPIHFQSFNDYKPGLYFYIVLPFVKLFGLTEWVVRAPAAFLGVATVLSIYLLVKEMFADEKLANYSALFLAISPWHIHFSRGGWEVNVATFFITTAVWAGVKSINQKVSFKWLVVAVILAVCSFYTYHSARVVVPLLFLGLAVYYRQAIMANLKKVAAVALIGLVLCIPLVVDLAKPQIASRAAGVGLFADSGPLSRVEEQRSQHSNFQGTETKVLHNKLTNYGLAFLDNWTKHFWGEFLFLSGDEIQRNKVPETGQLYYFDFVFIAIALVIIVRNSSKWWPIIIWLMVAPVAAALTFQSPHALRSQNMVIPLVVLSAFGFSKMLASFSRLKSYGYLALIGLLFTLGWQFARYEHMYWVHMAKDYPYSSQYGVKELVGFVKEKENDFQKILTTDRYDQPYILFLFYTKYPPHKFQANHTLTPRDKYGFSTVNHFDKYYFSAIRFDEARPDNPNTLIVGTDEDIPKEANIIKNIYGTNGFLYFQVVAN